MSEPQSLAKIFGSFQDHINEEQDVKEEIRLVVRDLDQKAREILATCQAIHQPSGLANLGEICSQARSQFSEITQQYLRLQEKVPENQYHRFHDHWRFGTQRLCFLAVLVCYLETDTMATREEVATMMGVKIRREEGFHLELDDYLMGLLQLASELSRLAVNAVTAGDYGRPNRIARFVGELDSGFRLLNLKNDSLRKRFDGLKYDLKKVEEVVYDVTIRHLQDKEGAAT